MKKKVINGYMRKFVSSILFVFALIIIAYYYNYHEIVFKRPQSVHKWRQSDCASIALNYYQGGMKFFQPETHNLTSDGGTSGKASTSEVPILYYTVAALYKVFGYNESVFRILNTLLFFLGLFYLFRLLNYLLKDGFWSITISILIFTSPVLVFYGNNFLSNSSALAFSIIGWYYFIKFYFEKKQTWFYFSILAFLIAASFKVTALFSLIAIGGIYILELLRLACFKKNGKVFNRPLFHFISILAVFILIGLWLVYAHIYNQKHDCTYFSTTIFPIWELDKDGILSVWERIKNVWLKHYFHGSVLMFLLACILFIAIFYKKNFKLLNFALIIIFSEIIFYVVLQFWTFADHDYYTINIYILPVIIFASAFYILRIRFYTIFRSLFFKAGFLLLLIFNIYYAHQKNDERYYGWMSKYAENKDIYTITPYLREIGISENDTIISIPDGSHVSLYLMNQKGWTEYSDARFNRGERIRYNQDSTGVQKSIDRGARYMVVRGIEELYRKPYLQNFCTHVKGTYNNALIFDLKNKKINFNLQQRTIEKNLYCGAELLSKDGKGFKSERDSLLFRNGETQSDGFSYSGKYSSKLNAGSSYGMTINIQELKFGESFEVSVWKKATGNSKGNIIASGKGYYNGECEVVEKDANGWEKLRMEFFVTKEMENLDLVVYVYNPDENPVYFDDFEIVRYKSVFE